MDYKDKSCGNEKKSLSTSSILQVSHSMQFESMQHYACLCTNLVNTCLHKFFVLYKFE